jgi:oligogalacturonide lyase
VKRPPNSGRVRVFVISSRRSVPSFVRALGIAAALAFLVGYPAVSRAQDAAPSQEPPKSWIDPDTGHRVIRLSDEPGSDSFYFNFNAYTPDGKEMIYTTTDGTIRVLNLDTLTTRALASGITRAIVVGHKTPTIYYTKFASAANDPYFLSLWAANIDTGENRKISRPPAAGSVVTINADETLGAGSYIEGDAVGPGVYGGVGKGTTQNSMGAKNLGEPENKGQMMEERLRRSFPSPSSRSTLQTGPSPSSSSTARTGSTISSSRRPTPPSSCTATRAPGRRSIASGPSAPTARRTS